MAKRIRNNTKRNDMRTGRVLSMILGVAVSMGLLSGCQATQSLTDTKTTESVQGEKESEWIESTQQETTAWVDYAYTKELNVIDDNYRNYYEIFVYSFYDSNGDGIGDLNGVTQKLDYIADMGFNGIWLMPVMSSPSYHKYDTDDYYQIDSAYGTNEDMKNLLEKAHEKGIRVMIDFVMNHSSSEHPWFKEAYSYLQSLPEGEDANSKECSYVDYYHFMKDGQSGCVVTGTSWTYEAQFSYSQPDLNLANDAVRKEFEDIAKFWVDMGVDGFRMDAAMHFEEGDTAFNCEILNWLYQYCVGLNPDFYMVSEVWSNAATIANYYESQTPSMFNFATSDTDGCIEKTVNGNYTATDFVNKMKEFETSFAAVNPNYIDAVFITNHDQVRVCNNLHYEESLMKYAGGLMMTMSGSPFVYYGEEIGMKSSGKSDENKRVAMNWSGSESTGMCEGPKEAESFEQKYPAVDEQQADRASILNYYKQALRLRNENPELARGIITVCDAWCKEETALITKTYDDSTIGIVYNTSDTAQSVDLSGSPVDAMQIRGYLTVDGSEVTFTDGCLLLPARSICILK